MQPTDSTFPTAERPPPEPPTPWWQGLLTALVLTVAAVSAGWLAGGG